MKRPAALLLACALLYSAALAEPCILEWSCPENNDYCQIVTREGTPLTGPYLWRDIDSLGCGLYSAVPYEIAVPEGVDPEDEYGYTQEVYESVYLRALLDGEGRALTDAVYSQITYDDTGLSLQFRKPDGTLGAMDLQGHELFSGSYYTVAAVAPGAWYVSEITGEYTDGDDWTRHDCRLLYIDSEYKAHDTGITGTDLWLSDTYGLLPVPDGKTEHLWHLMDAQGNIRFDIEAESLYPVRGGLLLGRDLNDAEFLMDEDGDLLLEGYESISEGPVPDSSILLCKYRPGSYMLFDAAARRFTGMLQPQGEEIENVWQYSSGLYCASTATAESFYDDRGRFLCSIPYEYRNGSAYADVSCMLENSECPRVFPVHLYSDTEGSRTVLCSADGTPVLDNCYLIFCCSWKDGSGRYLFSSERRGREFYGICDEKGDTVIPAVYEWIQPVDFDRYWCSSPNGCTLLDEEGNILYRISEYSGLID